jgi:hypothetical protein
MNDAYSYVVSNGGINMEESYPYKAVQGTCKYKNDTENSGTCTDYINVESADVIALMNAVADKGPVSVAIDASRPTFQLYKSGVYDDPSCNSTKLNHGGDFSTP